MADVLLELVSVLQSKDGRERNIRLEDDVFGACKNKIVTGLGVGCSIGAGLVWVASRQLNTFLRVNLAAGAGYMTAMWSYRKSLDLCVDHILAMDGSQMQHELTKIVLQRYGNDPQRMQAFSKHFYAEEVFNDSTPGYPKSVYRPRSLFIDNQSIANANSYNESDAKKDDIYRQQRNEDPDSVKLKRPTMDIPQARIYSGFNIATNRDPLDILFGYSSANEESHKPDDSGISTKVQSRRQRRVHRKHRMRHLHRQESLSPEEA